MNTITLFGSSGKTGLELINSALSKNFCVKAFCRSKKSITLSHEKLIIIEGNVLNPEEVLDAVHGSNYIICALGTKPLYTDIYCEESAINIVNTMKNSGIKRLICLTGAMIGENHNNLSPLMKFLKRKYESNYPLIANDRAKQESVIIGSGLDWTILKPPRLTYGKLKACKTGQNLKVSGLSSVSRKSLAQLIINILDDISSYNKSLIIKN